MLKIKAVRDSAGLAFLLLMLGNYSSFGTDSRQLVRGNIPPAVAKMQAIGSYPTTNQLQLAISLPVRNEAALDDLIRKLYDPASPSYHQYLTPQQFAENFGPTIKDYQALIHFAERNGLRVTGTHPNRLVLDVAGSVADIERTFQTKIRVYDHPKDHRKFYAPDAEPSGR